MGQNEIVRFALNNCCRNKEFPISEPSGSCFTTGHRPESDWNRPIQCYGRCSCSENREAIPHGRRNGVKAVRKVVWDRELITPGDPIRLFIWIYDCGGG